MSHRNPAKKQFDLITVGEMMLRYINGQPHAAGACLNVAAGLARTFGWPHRRRLLAGMISGVVSDSIGREIIAQAQAAGLDTSLVGAVPNDSTGEIANVIYELRGGFGEYLPPSAGYFYRAHSPMARIVPTNTDWEKIFAENTIRALYSDGICLGLQRFAPLGVGTQQLLTAGYGAAFKRGVLTCFDTNFRLSLWNDRGALAGAAAEYRKLLPMCRVLTGSVGHFRALLERPDTDHREFAHACLADQDLVVELLKATQAAFPSLQVISASIREEENPSVHGWRCALLAGGQVHFSQPYSMQVVDRPGIGDAMTLQILAGCLNSDDPVRPAEPQKTVERAAAHGWLMSQVRADLSPFRLSDVDAVWGQKSVVIQR